MFDYDIEAQMLDTPDGTTYCANVRDLREVMEKYISVEFANYVSLLINQSEEDTAYEIARANTDADAIAEENDYLRSQLSDTEEILTQITEDITEKQRINKNDLFNKLLALIDAINTVL